MCTVSYIPTQEGFYLTSNRDENINRGRAFYPKTYSFGKNLLLYPKDSEKKGSWIIAKDNGDVVVLLNGAFENHIRQPYYRESRGKILLDIMKSKFPLSHFSDLDLKDIEPFTLILYTQGKLFECRWDSIKKHIKPLNPRKEYIWSSHTLYDASAQAKRNHWFEEWIELETSKSSQDILQFHSTTGMDDPNDSLLLNRDGKMRTVSITQIQYKKEKMKMIYSDLIDNKNHEEELMIKGPFFRFWEESSRKIHDFFKRRIIKITHWEYWPFNVFYGPIMPYWFWLGIKSRSFFFFNTSNPSIQNGGFAMESKSLIYDQIPEAYKPKTILIKPLTTSLEDIHKGIQEQNLKFPLIAKPDIGYQGILVKKLNNENDLAEYANRVKVNFLIQEFIPYKNEVGIFYYKIPGESNGHISGIVGKDFLKVIGDGKSTLEELIVKDSRAFLQIKNLKITYSQIFKDVLEKGKELLLVPYGNHARGAKFLDHSHLISPELIQMINRICLQIPEFYFGRLDIMYNTWEELCQGKNFCIVELNGAGSEPTHIYDPKHSVFFAYREIIRHWNILYTICHLNKEQKDLKFLNLREGLQLLKENGNYFKIVRQI